MVRARSRPRWRLFLLATACAATAFTPSAGAASEEPAEEPAGATCAMPDCHGALVLDPETGFFAVAKNFPTEQAARRRTLATCREQEEGDRACAVLRSAAGERCIAGAMRVEDGAIIEHATAVRVEAGAALRAAAGKLDGPEEQHHRIAVVCNG